MIEVVFDIHGLEDKGPAFVVSDPSSYPQCRLHIRRAASNGTDLRVVVTNPGMVTWFSDLVGDDRIELIRRDPLLELRQALGTSDLPDILLGNPRLIGEWGLLHHADHKPRSQSVTDWLLGRQLGEAWASAHTDQMHIARLLGSLAESNWSAIDGKLRDLAVSKLVTWAAAPSATHLLGWIKDNPGERSVLFGLAQRLAGYPTSQVMGWLGSSGWADLAALDNWRRIASEVPLIELSALLIPARINVSVRTYLLSQVGHDPVKLEEAITQISGALAGEVAALEKILEGWTAPVSRNVVELLRSKLGDHELVRELDALVSPPAPSMLPANSVSSVLEWVYASYTPYYRWTRRTRQEHLTEPFAKAFEDWYVGAAYGLNTLDVLALGVTDHASKVAEDSVLLVIVDGLGVEWTDDLLGILRDNGLVSSVPMQTRLTISPSITAYAKPAMIRGVRPAALPDKSWNTAEYANLLSARIKDQPVDAISNLDPRRKLRQLVTAEETGKGFYLYLANGLDEILHQSLGESKRRQEARAYLSDICSSIREACEYYATSFAKVLPVVITGDHGHCTLPETARDLGTPELGSVSHGRILELHEVPSSVPNGTILLEPDLWGLKHPILVASGYSYWGTKPSGGVHGGCTPEEMVVPVITVQLGATATDQVEPLVFSVLGDVRRNRPNNAVLLQVVNPNNHRVTLSHLAMDGLSLVDNPLPATIGAQAKVEWPVNVDGRGMRRELESMDGRCTFECLGKIVPQTLAVPVHTIGGAIDDFDII